MPIQYTHDFYVICSINDYGKLQVRTMDRLLVIKQRQGIFKSEMSSLAPEGL